MKKIISLLLVLCFILTALMACGGEETPSDSAAPSGSAAGDGSGDGGGTLAGTNEWGDQNIVYTIDPEEHDYAGDTLTMIIRNDDKIKREFGREGSTEEINEQIVTRNTQVQSGLNMTVIPEYIGSSDAGLCREEFAKKIQGDVDGDQHMVDIAAHFGYYASDVGIREYSANLLDEDVFPHFDFTIPCWNQSIVKNSNINGKSLVCGGDMTLSIFNFAMVIWHNKTLYAANRQKVENSPEDIQDLVLDGAWTAYELYKWSQFYENTSASDECDLYGVHLQGAPWATQPTDVLPFAWQLNLMTTNSDGTHAYNIIGNDKAEEAIKTFRNMYSGQGNSFKHIYAGDCTKGFTGGEIVFAGDVLSWTEESDEKRRDMTDQYCLLPWPKYDELQVGKANEYYEDLGYYTTAQDCYSLIGVVDHFTSTVPTKGEMVSAYLQYTSELSYKDVRGYYFEKVVRGKNLGVDDTDGTVTKSIRIFNMIVNNLQFDYWALYSASLGDIMHLFRKTTAETSDTLENQFKQGQSKYESDLKTADIWFGLVTE